MRATPPGAGAVVPLDEALGESGAPQRLITRLRAAVETAEADLATTRVRVVACPPGEARRLLEDARGIAERRLTLYRTALATLLEDAQD
jgi:hypothetical protein